MEENESTNSRPPYLRRILLIFFAVLSVVLILANRWEKSEIEKEKEIYTPIGDFVDLGSYKAHYYTKGTEGPAVVFIAGSGTPSSYCDFYYLQEDLSNFCTTISFDRAGLGWSESTDKMRYIDALAEELSTLINETAKDKQVILVAHSLGSLEAIHYTQKYPEKVSGIVFLDGGSPEYYRDAGGITSNLMNRGSSVLRNTGILRLFSNMNVLFPMYGEEVRNNKLPEEVRKIDTAMYNRYAGNKGVREYFSCMNINAETICNGNKLGDLPLLVLSSDADDSWANVQIQLAGWSNNSTQKTIEGSSHYLHWSNREEVTNEISTFIENVISE